MGFMQEVFGGSTTKTKQFQLPGAFQSGKDPRRIATNLEDLLSRDINLSGQTQLFPTLMEELQNPTFAPQTSSELSILESIMDLTGGRSANRGLGMPTQGALAQSIAPTLANQRNQRVSNLAQALGLGRDFRGQTLGGLSGLLESSLPQHVFQPQTKQSVGIIPALTAGGQAAASMKTAFA